MTNLDAAEQVLLRFQWPMTAEEITRQAIGQGWLPPFGPSRKTPHATLTASLAVDIKKNGYKSRFARLGPNMFGLRNWDWKSISDLLKAAHYYKNSQST